MNCTRARAGRRAVYPGCLVLVAALGGTGCSGEQRQTVEGSVTLAGQPLPSGVVQLHGPGDRLATAVVQPDGSFTATDVLPGEVKVAVVEDPSATASKSGSMAPPRGSPPPPGGTTPAAPKRVSIPQKYKDPKTSGLAYTIAPATKRIDVKLE